MEKKVFKKDENKLEGIQTLGQLLLENNPGIQCLIEWATNKEKQAYDSVHSLISNSAVDNRAIFYNLGEARSIRSDLMQFLKWAEQSYIAGRKTKTE